MLNLGQLGLVLIRRNKMNPKDIQIALEAISKSGVKVAGDLVIEKHVEYEVDNVEAGGI